MTLRKRRRNPFLPIILFGLGGLLLFRYGEQWLRQLLLYLSGASWARRTVTDLPLGVAGCKPVHRRRSASKMRWKRPDASTLKACL